MDRAAEVKASRAGKVKWTTALLIVLTLLQAIPWHLAAYRAGEWGTVDDGVCWIWMIPATLIAGVAT